MPRRPGFEPLLPTPPDQVRRTVGLPAAKRFKTKFPKRAVRRLPDARAAMKRWQEAQPAPAAIRNPDVKIRAIRLKSADVAGLRAIADSSAPIAEMIQNQKMGSDALFGTLFSALATYEFMKLEAEYRRRRGTGRSLAATEKRWQEIIRTFQGAFARAGLRGVTEADLRGFVRQLTASRTNLDAVIRIANSGVALGAPTVAPGAAGVVASFLPTVEKIIDPSTILTTIKDLCDDPIAEGSFTKHFSHSVSLYVKIKYPCGISWSGIKWCTKKVTLAGVSFSIGVNVGYKVNCCGATAWGQGYAQVCATIVGIKVCAGCSATITGVAGVSRTPVGTQCSYGLGINAVLQCKLAGITILYLSVPFGWTVTGPCPPPGLC